MGANGAGKSTLMLAIMGLLDREPFNGRFMGEIIFNGRVINGLPAERIVKLGVSLVPEGKLLFPSLTVRDNLELGTYPIRNELDKETKKRNNKIKDNRNMKNNIKINILNFKKFFWIMF